jgi:hypothetical protein
MKALSLAIVLAGLVPRLFALEDTPNNRAKLADRFVRTFPVQDWWAGVEGSIESTIPKNQRDLARSILRYMDWNAVARAWRQAIIEVFSVDEIQALAEAYSSPVGRSMMRKAGSRMSAGELQATENYFSTPIGRSILRKQPIFASTMEQVWKREILKAYFKAALQERR